MFWQGNHNIQETKTSKYKSDDIGEEISDCYEAWYGEILRKNDLSTMLDETRYLKCSKQRCEVVDLIEVSFLAPVTTVFRVSPIETYEVIS